MPIDAELRAPPLSHASTLRLPPGAWATVLDCLCAHFPGIDRVEWRIVLPARVLDAAGVPLTIDAAYRNGLTIRYFREVADEPRIPFEASIIHVDKEIVIADKPHFLAVMPAGRFVEETLLRRLMRQLDNPHLVPLHRIDRGTAGLVMFSANPATRSRYQALFRQQCIEKLRGTCPGIARIVLPVASSFPHRWRGAVFRMQEEPGASNSETRIGVIDRGGRSWRYALQPVSGRKHQLRVHMASLGAPILNDPLYPQLAEAATDDYTSPLKLLARSLAFVDPLDGRSRQFKSLLDI